MPPRSFDSPALSTFFKKLQHIPLLTAEEEVALARKIRDGDDVAFDRMVMCNARLVVKMAKPYRNQGIPFEDLISEGMLGLMEAAQRFDPDQGNRFVTCAVWWIRKALLRALRNQTRLVRVPAFQSRREGEIRAAEQALRVQLGRVPDRQEIAARLDAPVQYVDKILNRNTSEFSLNEPVSDGESTTWSDRLAELEPVDQEDDLIRREELDLIQQALSELPEREREVIERRYGIQRVQPEVLRQLGDGLGLSRERVRQIECQARERLRRLMQRKQRPIPSDQLAEWSCELRRRASRRRVASSQQAATPQAPPITS